MSELWLNSIKISCVDWYSVTSFKQNIFCISTRSFNVKISKSWTSVELRDFCAFLKPQHQVMWQPWSRDKNNENAIRKKKYLQA